MNKTITALLVISSVFLTGCADNQRSQTPQQPTETIQESKTFEFEHELFSLKLPAPYTEDVNGVIPKNEKDFPTIIFGNSKEKVEAEKLLEFEKEWFKKKWSQTSPSGKFISSKIVTIDGKNGIKFTIQYDQGRSLEDIDRGDMSGYLNEYHYSILNGGNLFRFWTSASDLENPEEMSKSFDKIIETITFK